MQNKETATPLHFVFMKATEGGDHNDTTFEANFANARNHGFIRGAYHFYIPGTDALKQADFFIRTVKLDTGDLPPVNPLSGRFYLQYIPLLDCPLLC